MRISRRMRAWQSTVSLTLALLACTPSLAPQVTSSAGLSPEDAALFQRGVRAQRDRDLPAAEKAYGELLARMPRYLPAHFNLGLVLDAEGRTAGALDAFDDVRSREPAFPGAQMFAGIENFKQGKVSAAAGALQIATTQSPDDVRGWLWLARAEYALGKDADGKAALDKALAISPNDASCLYLLAQSDISAQDLTGAERVLTGLVTRYPRVPEFHQSLGSVYYLEARLDKAEEEYRTQLQFDAGNPQALSMIGVILLDRGQAKEAMSYLTKGLEANPRIGYLQRKMGQALLESGDAEQSIGHLREAASLDAHDATAHFLLWKAYSATGRKPEAAAEMDTFRKLQSQPNTATQMLGIPAEGVRQP